MCVSLCVCTFPSTRTLREVKGTEGFNFLWELRVCRCMHPTFKKCHFRAENTFQPNCCLRGKFKAMRLEAKTFHKVHRQGHCPTTNTGRPKRTGKNSLLQQNTHGHKKNTLHTKVEKRRYTYVAKAPFLWVSPQGGFHVIGQVDPGETWGG